MQSRLYVAVGAICVLVIGITWWADDRNDPDPGGDTAAAVRDRSDDDIDQPITTVETTTTTTEPPYDGWADPAKSGRPWTTASVEGVLTFRGNPTRSYYGSGPVPRDAVIEYRFPENDAMCGVSTNLGTTKTWCGMGWTGQPVIAERDGVTWAVFGGYDGHIHFMDADTGERLMPDFVTGDLIKGTPTIDPDGFPLVYTGSRDNYLRILAIDGAEPRELWKFHADDVSPTLWNDDWDASPLIIDDYMFEGGENSQFVVFKLNRAIDPATGLVTVDPELVWNTPSWDQPLLDAIGDNTVSVENSPTIVGNTLYFANSGGLVQGWDLSGLADGIAPTQVFRYWVGDDTDATIVADTEGYLYVGVEYERGLERSRELGQLLKLDPTKEQPLVWSLFDRDTRPAGIWSTPAIADGVVYTSTNGGRLVGLDQQTGLVLWTKNLPGPLWGSPIVVDGVLIQGDCAGFVHAYDVSNPRVDPPLLWTIELGGCIEATPVVWDGRVLVGSRNGFLYALSERPAPTPTTATVPSTAGG